MNRKIPFQELSSRIATATGISEESADQFVRSFFELLTESMLAGETVKVKGIGHFAVVETDSERHIEFTPEKEITDAINAPFAMFEPETLNAGISNEMLNRIESADDSDQPVAETPQPIEIIAEPTEPEIQPSDDSLSEESAQQPIEEPTRVIETPVNESKQPDIAEEMSEQQAETNTVTKSNVPIADEKKTDIEKPTATEQHKMPVAPKFQNAVLPLEEDTEEFVESTNSGNSNGNFWIGLAVGLIVGLAIGACAVYFAIDHFFPTIHQIEAIESAEEIEPDPLLDLMLSTDTATTATPADTASTATQSADTAKKIVETAPVAPKVITDTIRRGYLIHDIAKRFFGNKDYWVYIYEENKAGISNPNNMQPGQVLVVPSAEKYGIIPGDAESLRKARNKAAEILRKYPH